MRGPNPAALAARLEAEVDSEILRLTKVVGEVEGALALFDEAAPTPLELRGLANLVHDFYTGIEKVFKRVAPELNGGAPGRRRVASSATGEHGPGHSRYSPRRASSDHGSDS